MPFQRILVAIDGSPGGRRPSRRRSSSPKIAGASLNAPAVEGRLPAYAATIGEVDEVKREKDVFFETLARLAREQARKEEVELEVDVRPGMRLT